MRHNPPPAKITIGAHAATAGGSSACCPSCWKPSVTSQN